MITLHNLDQSRGHRIAWLLEELGQPYDIVRYAREPGTLKAPPSLAAVHPLGKSPVIVDGDTTLAESGAIMSWLLARHGGERLLRTTGDAGFDHYLFWFHFGEGSGTLPLTLLHVLAPLAPASDGLTAAALAQLHRALNLAEDRLTQSACFADDAFSAADIMMSYPLIAARDRGFLPGSATKIAGFLDRMESRPAFQRASEKE